MEKMDWLLPSLITLLSWGLWGFFSKLASRYLDAYQNYVASSIITVVSLPALLLLLKPEIDVKSQGFNYSILAGAVGVLATIMFYSALRVGEASIVVPLTSLYPVVTIIFSYLLLNEKISLLKGAGIVLAIIAITLLSID